MRRKKIEPLVELASETKESLIASIEKLENDTRFNQGVLESTISLVDKLDDGVEPPKLIPNPPTVSLLWKVGERQLKLTINSPGQFEYTFLDGRAVKLRNRKLRFNGKMPMELSRLLSQFV